MQQGFADYFVYLDNSLHYAMIVSRIIVCLFLDWIEVMTMDGATVAQLISNVGFPIAMCLLMYYQSNTVIKANTEAINDLKSVLTARDDK